AAGDYGRYKNPALNALFDQYGATTDPAKQHDLIKQVEKIMLEDVPGIPVTEGVAWYPHSPKHVGGWPTRDSQFAGRARRTQPGTSEGDRGGVRAEVERKRLSAVLRVPAQHFHRELWNVGHLFSGAGRGCHQAGTAVDTWPGRDGDDHRVRARHAARHAERLA